MYECAYAHICMCVRAHMYMNVHVYSCVCACVRHLYDLSHVLFLHLFTFPIS